MSKFRDNEIEKAVLGSIISGWASPDLLLERVDSPDVFTSQSHRTIFGAIKNLVVKGNAVDLTTVCSELDSQKELDKVGGRSYIAGVATDEFMTPSGFNTYLEKLLSMHQGRCLVRAIQDGRDALNSPGFEFEDALELIQTKLFKLSERSNLNRSFSMKESVDNVMKELDCIAQGDLHKAGFIQTYFPQLDKRLLGFKRGDLIIIGGLRGEGKTQLAIQMALGQAMNGIPVDIESIEMGKDALVHRLMLYKSGVSSSEVTPELLNEVRYNKMKEAGRQLQDIPLIVTDDPGTTPERLMSRVRRLVVERGVSVVYIDYLQLMQTNVKDGNREREVSHAAQVCKLIARECNVVVVALSQLTEIEDGHRPTLSALRESKAIGHHADIVLFPWHKKKEQVSLISIGKNRNRDIGTDVEMGFLWHNSGWWTETADFGKGSEYEKTFKKEKDVEQPDMF